MRKKEYSRNPYIYFLQKMRDYSPKKGKVVRILSFGLIAQVIWLLEPYFLGSMINVVQNEGFAGWNKILIYLGLMFASGVVGWYFHGNSRVREQLQSFTVGEQYLTSLFHKINALGMDWHTDNHSGKTIDKTSKAVNAIKDFISSSFMYIGTPVRWLGAFFSLLFLWRPAALMMALAGVIVLRVVQNYDKKIIPLIKERNEKEHNVMSTLFDFLSNIKTVITLRCEHVAVKAVEKMIAHVYPPYKRQTILNEWKWFVMGKITDVALITILISYMRVEFSGSGVVMLGTLTMLIQYSQKIENAFDNFTRQYSGIVRMQADMQSIDDVEDAYRKLSEKTKHDISLGNNDITIADLHFSYPHQEDTISHRGITMNPGKKIALVGASGSGKSTIMALLRGLYTPGSCRLHIGNDEFDTLDPLYQFTSLIPQDPEIFENTIKYNITMGLDFDEATVQHYCDLAAFSDVVEELPHGLDTDIKERGVNLSGGQKQRLALARGLLMAEESPVILLDESTSSVDALNEKKIYQSIFDKYDQKYIIASIHKLHLLDMFDEVIVMQGGRIIEQGTFSNLVAHEGGLLAALRQEYETVL